MFVKELSKNEFKIFFKINETMKSHKPVYTLTVEDIQTVARDIRHRELNTQEIELINEKIASYFSDWYERVESAINSELVMDEFEEE